MCRSTTITISMPDIPQDALHWVMYYSGCHIEAAMSTLQRSAPQNWPANWRICLEHGFDLQHLLQQIYITRLMTPVPTLACQVLYHCNITNTAQLQVDLAVFENIFYHLIDDISQLLLSLDPEKAGEFNATWWLDYGVELHWDLCDLRAWSEEYFQGRWADEVSPLDKRAAQTLDDMEQDLVHQLVENECQLLVVEQDMHLTWVRRVRIGNILRSKISAYDPAVKEMAVEWVKRL